jgi:hypothetical protein
MDRFAKGLIVIFSIIMIILGVAVSIQILDLVSEHPTTKTQIIPIIVSEKTHRVIDECGKTHFYSDSDLNNIKLEYCAVKQTPCEITITQFWSGTRITEVIPVRTNTSVECTIR